MALFAIAGLVRRDQRGLISSGTQMKHKIAKQMFGDFCFGAGHRKLALPMLSRQNENLTQRGFWLYQN
jgi:hypothetical protein